MEEKMWRISALGVSIAEWHPSEESIPAVSEERCMEKSPNNSLIVKL